MTLWFTLKVYIMLLSFFYYPGLLFLGYLPCGSTQLDISMIRIPPSSQPHDPHPSLYISVSIHLTTFYEETRHCYEL